MTVDEIRRQAQHEAYERGRRPLGGVGEVKHDKDHPRPIAEMPAPIPRMPIRHSPPAKTTTMSTPTPASVRADWSQAATSVRAERSHRFDANDVRDRQRAEAAEAWKRPLRNGK